MEGQLGQLPRHWEVSAAYMYGGHGQGLEQFVAGGHGREGNAFSPRAIRPCSVAWWRRCRGGIVVYNDSSARRRYYGDLGASCGPVARRLYRHWRRCWAESPCFDYVKRLTD